MPATSKHSMPASYIVAIQASIPSTTPVACHFAESCDSKGVWLIDGASQLGTRVDRAKKPASSHARHYLIAKILWAARTTQIASLVTLSEDLRLLLSGKALTVLWDSNSTGRWRGMAPETISECGDPNLSEGHHADPMSRLV